MLDVGSGGPPAADVWETHRDAAVQRAMGYLAGLMTLPVTVADIRAARERLAGRLHVTPMLSATRVGAPRGVQLFLKCESLQKTGSFKPRGALNKIDRLTPDERARGVVAVSAGNHAQALAWAASASGVRATVVMPERASRAKVEASRGYGGDVVLFGETSVQALDHARALERERGLTFVHPFDDADVVAGAGTVGLELVDQLDDVDAIVVPVGGGGLIAGIAVAAKALRPSVRVYGVEPEGARSMRDSLDAGRALRAERPQTIADGLAAPMAGEIPFAVVRQLVDDVVLVSDAEVAEAMRALATSAKLVAEGGGAAATAAIMTGRVPLPRGARVAAIVSGGNVDASLYARVMAGEHA